MRHRVFAAVQIGLSLVLLAVVVWRHLPSQLGAELVGANYAVLLLTLMMVPILVMLRAVRWHVLARTRDPHIPMALSFHSYMAGLALAVITPFSAGELARGAFAAPSDRAGFVGLTFLDKMLDVTSLMVLVCSGFMVVAPGRLKLAGAGAMLLLFVAIASARSFAGFAATLMPRWRFVGALMRGVEAGRAVPTGTLLGCFVVAVGNFALLYFHLFLIMYAFAPEIDWRAAGLFPMVTFISRAVPSIAGLGVREFTASAIFAEVEYNISSTGAVVATFLQFVGANVLPAGAWLLVSGGFRRFFAAAREGGGD